MADFLQQVHDALHNEHAEYTSWVTKHYSAHLLQEETVLQQLDETQCLMTVPYHDRHGHRFQFVVLAYNENFIVHDNGATLADLQLDDIDLHSDRVQRAFHKIARKYTVSLVSERIQVRATFATFCQRAHDSINARFAINDLSFFFEKRS